MNLSNRGLPWNSFFWFLLRTSCVYNIWHIFYRYCIRVVRVLWSQLTFWLSILAWRKPWLVTAVFVVFAQMSRLQWGHTRIHDRPSLAYKKLNINSEAWRRLDFWLRFNIYISQNSKPSLFDFAVVVFFSISKHLLKKDLPIAKILIHPDNCHEWTDSAHLANFPLEVGCTQNREMCPVSLMFFFVRDGFPDCC